MELGYGALLALSLLLCVQYAAADDGEGAALVSAISKYRTEEVGVGALAANAGATCMAKKVLDEAYDGKACSNTTGLDTVPGQEANYPDFPNWLSDCGISLDRAKDGVILPECVPSSAGLSSESLLSVAVDNYTHSSDYVNSTAYSSAGAASDNGWFVLVLATNASSGDYLQTQPASPAPRPPSPSFALLAFLLPSLFLASWKR